VGETTVRALIVIEYPGTEQQHLKLEANIPDVTALNRFLASAKRAVVVALAAAQEESTTRRLQQESEARLRRWGREEGV